MGDNVEVSIIIEALSEKAIMFLEGGEEIWVPISQILVDGEEKERADFEIGELLII